MPFTNPVIGREELIRSGIRSNDYVEASAGWRVGRQGEAQFNTINALTSVSSGVINASTGINLVGTDISTLINNRAKTVYSGNAGPLTLPNAVGTSGNYVGIQLVKGTSTSLEVGRTYLFVANTAMAPSGVTGEYYFYCHYTTNGVDPTEVSGTNIRTWWHNSPNDWHTATFIHPFTVSSNTGQPFKWVFCGGRSSGTGTLKLIDATNGAHYGSWFGIIDLGPTSLIQTGIAAPAFVNPPTTYERYYYATWSRSFNGDTGATTWDDSAYCYQGYYSSARGNTVSLVGFDYGSIQADLSGATINSMSIAAMAAHSYYYSGVLPLVGTHVYTSKPSSINYANTNLRRFYPARTAAGNIFEHWVATSVGDEFKNGNAKGIVFGPDPTVSYDYYGYFNGATQGNPPRLRINYTK